MVNNIESNGAIISAESRVGMGAMGTLAVAGIAGSTQLSNVAPSYNLGTMDGIFEFLGNLEATVYGRALYLMTGMIALLYYVVVLIRRNEKKGKKK